MSTEAFQVEIDPRDKYRESLRKKRFRRRLLRAGGLWGGFALVILLTVVAFEAVGTVIGRLK